MKAIFIALFVIVVIGCNKSDDDNVDRMAGKYEGTFKRYNLEGSQTANVQLTFNRSSFTGTSDINKYPAIGSGSFTIIEGGIKFKNQSVWTADFDGTLILDGNYIAIERDDSLRITKSYGNGWVDAYHLKKK